MKLKMTSILKKYSVKATNNENFNGSVSQMAEGAIQNIVNYQALA